MVVHDITGIRLQFLLGAVLVAYARSELTPNRMRNLITSAQP